MVIQIISAPLNSFAESHEGHHAKKDDEAQDEQACVPEEEVHAYLQLNIVVECMERANGWELSRYGWKQGD